MRGAAQGIIRDALSPFAFLRFSRSRIVPTFPSTPVRFSPVAAVCSVSVRVCLRARRAVRCRVADALPRAVLRAVP